MSKKQILSVKEYITLRCYSDNGADIGVNKKMDEFEDANDMVDATGGENRSRKLMSLETFLDNLIQHLKISKAMDSQ